MRKELCVKKRSKGGELVLLGDAEAAGVGGRGRGFLSNVLARS